MPASTGRQVPDSPSEDEDDEGRSETEQLVDEGAEEAERDRMFQAAHETEKSDRREPSAYPTTTRAAQNIPRTINKALKSKS